MEEYRSRAEEASAAAAHATLEQNRLRHEHAAVIWSGLADAEEARTVRHHAAVAMAAANRRFVAG
jgi:hypothetical protein